MKKDARPIAERDLLALAGIRQQCPEWREQPAWNAIAGSFARWAGIFGDLRLFVALRRKRDT